MNSPDDIDLVVAYKKLLAENKSLEGRLADYGKIIESRDSEIDMLQNMLSEANEYRSTLDAQVKELKDLKQYMNELKQQADQTTYMASGMHQQAGDALSVERQFENLKLAYANLQAQLSALQMQLLDMNNRNLLLQQQTSRISELESILANVEAERDEMHNNENPPD